MDKRNFNIKFEWLEVVNGKVFKKAKIPLANQGLVSILGKNGVGKSTIGNLIEAIIYGSTASGHKKNDLVQNDLKAKFGIKFSINDKSYMAYLNRVSKKWSYDINEFVDGKPISQTPHSLRDGPSKLIEILNLTKAEFEGSIHLTQDTQHILISGKLAQRKEYISDFFGIDYRYDHVLEQAKEKLGIVKDKITNINALIHTETLLASELDTLADYTEDKKSDLVEEIDVLKASKDKLDLELNKLKTDRDARKIYEDNFALASSSEDPEKEIAQSEQKLIELKSQKAQAKQIQERNQNAAKVNKAIDDLEKELLELTAKFPSIVNECDLGALSMRFNQLQLIKNQDLNAKPLKKELETLPDLDELHVDETGLQKAKVEYQVLLNKRKAIASGKCDQCGSEFTQNDIGDIDIRIADYREIIDILTEDFKVIKIRNQKAQRRKLLLRSLANISPFEPFEKELLTLQAFIPAKKEYHKITDALKILERTELQPEINTAVIDDEIKRIELDLVDLRKVLKAKSLMPDEVPEQPYPEIAAALRDKLLEGKNLDDKKSTLEQTLGQISSKYDRKKEVESQLAKIRIKISKLEDLKKEEFFWAKMVDAYGTKGLRLQHLDKMMKIIIQRLPIYANILFSEKGLSFKYRCEPNSIEIIACRQQVDDKGNTRYFEHDISLFSGGERSRMSIALILTLADCVPVRKRANILILDEVDSDIDDDGKFRFVNNLLPMLKRKYESIFVISHSSDIQQAMVYSQTWTLTKKNHWASITMKKVE